MHNSAAFQAKFLTRDLQAGIITGAMAIPLSAGIALMSEYPIKVALTTVACACFIGWINAWIRPGNYIGAPGVAAGLAPVLALGVAHFGMENMAFIVFLTAFMQAVIWKFNLQKYILLAVPEYLVEGLLAGVGLKIVLNFLTMTYEIPESLVTEAFWNSARIQMALLSLAGFAVFLYLFARFQSTQPAIPYFFLIFAGVSLAQFVAMPMLHVEDVPIVLSLPLPHFDHPLTWLYVIGFAAMLAIIDVIEQVMSNAAIQKIDPLQRKCNTNNSL
ncbi:MAG: SulP family inorganic anion transporter, partial [Betaproteobacteria bacterium]|nr:SulP family inorganic anion transporter [Betaproteobacteria bacterium]